MPPRKPTRRKPLPDFGVKGTLRKRRGVTVRGFLETVGGQKLVRLEWREEGRRRTASWPDTDTNRAVARAWGEGKLEQLDRLARGEAPVEPAPAPEAQPTTLRELWEKYVAALEPSVRAKTLDNYEGRWRKFELWAGKDREARTITREDLDLFRGEIAHHAPNQVRAMFAAVLRVFRFGIDRDLVPPSKLLNYEVKFKRGEGKALDIPEYAPDEARRILAQFDPRDARDWRGYVATYLFAFAGPRQNAARHLEWTDVDLAAGTIRWRAALDKMGEDRVQPVPPQVLEALWVAYGWRIATGYTGRYVLFRPGLGTRDLSNGGARSARQAARAARTVDQPWSYSAYNARLLKAERAAKVPHVKYRAAHGFRRFVVTEAHARTGNLVLAGRYVGDRDLRTLTRSYVKDRPEELQSVAATVAAALTKGNETATAAPNGTAEGDPS